MDRQHALSGNGMNLPELWMKRLCAGSVDDVLALYNRDAVLIPTFGNTPVRGLRAIASYLHEFVGERPMLCGSVGATITQFLGGSIQAFSGEYTFSWRGGCTTARFTFVVVDRFGIATHHSSESPR